MPDPEMCVIFNPAAGKGRAAERLDLLRHDWGSKALFRPTSHAGHAVELAHEAALNGIPLIVAAGGDGTVHEVATGLLRANRPDVQFAIIPIGSANDYAHSVNAEAHATCPFRVDVGKVRAPDGREEFFLCCLGLGFNGAVTLESRRIRRLQGVALYGLATLRALWHHFQTPFMTIQFDDEAPTRAPTLMLSVLCGRREGGFVLAPDARLDDGLLNYLLCGALTRWDILSVLPRLALRGPPEHHPKMRQGLCRRVRLESAAPLIVHVDGEFFCKPEDNVRELLIEVLPGALRVRHPFP